MGDYMKQNDLEENKLRRINGLFVINELNKLSNLSNWEKMVRAVFVNLFDMEGFEEVKENETLCKFCIERVDNNRWKSYILENDKKIANNDYDDFYDLCIHIINHIFNQELREKCLEKFPTRAEILRMYLIRIRTAQMEELGKMTDRIEEAYRNGVPLELIRSAIDQVLSRLVEEEKSNRGNIRKK